MPFQAVPNTFQVAVRGTLQGDLDMTNVFHVTDAGAATLTQGVADVISDFFAEFWDDIKGLLNTECVLTDCVVTDLRTLGAPEFVSTSSWPKTGTNASGPLPNQNAAQCNMRAGLRGPWYRGRVYLSGFALDTNDHSGLTAGAHSTLATEFDTLRNELSLGGVGLRIVSRFFDGAPRVTALSTPVTQTTVNLLWASMARRRRGA